MGRGDGATGLRDKCQEAAVRRTLDGADRRPDRPRRPVRADPPQRRRSWRPDDRDQADDPDRDTRTHARPTGGSGRAPRREGGPRTACREPSRPAPRPGRRSPTCGCRVLSRTRGPPEPPARHQGTAQRHQRVRADSASLPVEHAFARLRRCRRLSRCYEECGASAKAHLELAGVSYLLAPWTPDIASLKTFIVAE